MDNYHGNTSDWQTAPEVDALQEQRRREWQEGQYLRTPSFGGGTGFRNKMSFEDYISLSPNERLKAINKGDIDYGQAMDYEKGYQELGPDSYRHMTEPAQPLPSLVLDGATRQWYPESQYIEGPTYDPLDRRPMRQKFPGIGNMHPYKYMEMQERKRLEQMGEPFIPPPSSQPMSELQPPPMAQPGPTPQPEWQQMVMDNLPKPGPAMQLPAPLPDGKPAEGVQLPAPLPGQEPGQAVPYNIALQGGGSNLDNILAGQEAGLSLSDMMNPQGMEVGPPSSGSAPFQPKDNTPYENPVWYPDSGMSSGNEEGINKVRDMVLDEANDPNQGNRVLMKESRDGPGTTQKSTIRGKTQGHQTGTVIDQSSPDFGAQYDMNKWRYDPEIKRLVPIGGSGIGPGEAVGPGRGSGSVPGPGRAEGPIGGMDEPGGQGAAPAPGVGIPGMGGMDGSPDPEVMIPEAPPLPGPNRGMPPMAPPQEMPPSQARPMPAPMPIDVPPMDGMTPPMPPTQPRPLPPQANTLPPAPMPEVPPQSPFPQMPPPPGLPPTQRPLPPMDNTSPLPQPQATDAPGTTPGETPPILPPVEKLPPSVDPGGQGGGIGGRSAEPGEQVFGIGPSDERKPLPPLPPSVDPRSPQRFLDDAEEFRNNFLDELIGPEQRKSFNRLIESLLGSNNPQETQAVEQQVASVLGGGAPIKTSDPAMSAKQKQAMQKLDINNDGVVTQDDIFGLPTMRIADVTNPDNPRAPQGDMLNKLRAYRQQMG